MLQPSLYLRPVCLCGVLHKAGKRKAAFTRTRVDREVSRRLKRVRGHIVSAFDAWKGKIAKRAKRVYGAATKATRDDEDLVLRILNELQVEDVSVDVLEAITPELAAMFKDAGVFGVMQVGFNASPDIVKHMDKEALKYAEERAAELVKDLTKATRDYMRTQVEQAIETGASPKELANNIEESFGFSESRAETIARTELAMAHVEGNVEGWRETGEVEFKESILGDNHEIEDECDDAVEMGAIPLDAPFGDAGDNPPYHPNCVCDVLPVLKEPEESDKFDKYSDDQERDEQGRWTAGGGGDAAAHPFMEGPAAPGYKNMSAAEQAADRQRRREAFARLPKEVQDARREKKREGVRSRKAREKAGGVKTTVAASQNMRAVIENIRAKVAAQTFQQPYQATYMLRDALAEHEKTAKTNSVHMHSMKSSEKMHSVQLDHMQVNYPATLEGRAAAAASMMEYVRNPVPPELAQATSEITFTSQRSIKDAHWEKQFNTPGFVSAATGGDGRVVVYNGKASSIGTVSHEMGHNLATALYGDTTPPVDSPVGKLWKEWKERPNSRPGPVTDYGKNTASESFAEMAKLYATQYTELQEKHPAYAKAASKVFRAARAKYGIKGAS